MTPWMSSLVSSSSKMGIWVSLVRPQGKRTSRALLSASSFWARSTPSHIFRKNWSQSRGSCGSTTAMFITPRFKREAVELTV